MIRTLIFLAALLGFVGVGLGAFGAHGLAAYFAANPDSANTYHTATQYHMYHVLALLAVALLEMLRTYAGVPLQERWLRYAGWLFVTGIVLFSGSLYVLAVFQLRFMGAIAPLGGVAFLLGWVFVGLSARSITK
ncbi:MAG: DUF423 domain-containing protein [Anaerolineae bacterium]